MNSDRRVIVGNTHTEAHVLFKRFLVYDIFFTLKNNFKAKRLKSVYEAQCSSVETDPN